MANFTARPLSSITMQTVREIKIGFLLVDAATWIAYLEETPRIHTQAATVKAALAGVLSQLNGQDQEQYAREQRPANKFTFRITTPTLPIS